ncbi:pyoverdine biosynthesis regulatory [Thecamonas trahens ATCC 50062]|uniref:Pyoverdine biosynthesis regulatory n=1 Tax=Thecamonas trahens ATCC 50062 TaxID=461836 RepID=A0A0L0DV62_THETB|nr:pyoverdine biosynthesis regulatory [Thecamonas trahens ATCC 50062]KNC56100.1 pyoverdine biosynthesis regulatory [Thecamonas trahens ATCC 50062]|eukprot:XP_013761142.1 pyoverdine biosynthesis regulatory [Thecamonas trahens ATCC 50062]
MFRSLTRLIPTSARAAAAAVAVVAAAAAATASMSRAEDDIVEVAIAPVSAAGRRQQRMYHGKAFPLVVTLPGFTDVAAMKAALAKNKDLLLGMLDTHGAVLFRGLPLADAPDFMAFLEPFDFEYGDYIGGGGPRTAVLGPIHNSTFTPADRHIPFHHELAYLTKYPTKLAFFCQTKPQKNGETPILLSTNLYERIAAERSAFAAQVVDKGVIYTRVIDSADASDGKLQRSWQAAYGTDDRAVAEARARDTGAASIEWLESGAMRVVSHALPAARRDPRVGARTWFNAIVLLHPAAQEAGTQAPWTVTYGDGSPIADDDVLAAKAIMDEERIEFEWREGDVLLVDNMLAMHARNPFIGPRLILAAIAN